MSPGTRSTLWHRALSAALVAGQGLVIAGCAGSPDAGDERGDVERTLRAYFDAIMTQSARSFDTLTAEGFALIQNGHRIAGDRFSETWVEGRPLQTRYRQEGLEIDVGGPLAIAELELDWYENRALVQREAVVGLLRRDEGGWKVYRIHSTTLPLARTADGGTLDDYVGSYAVEDYRVEVQRRGEQLVTSRPGRVKWVAGLAEASLLPAGGDRFYLEATNSLVEFERDENGTVDALVLYEPFTNRGFTLARTDQAPSQSP